MFHVGKICEMPLHKVSWQICIVGWASTVPEILPSPPPQVAVSSLPPPSST